MEKAVLTSFLICLTSLTATDRQEIDSHVDEILEILSKNEPAPEYKQERNAVYYGDGEIPVSIFDHLSDKPKAETAPTPAPIPTPVQKPVNEPAPAPKPEPVAAMRRTGQIYWRTAPVLL